MSKIDTVRAAMMQAMKDKNKERKDALSLLLSALKSKQIDKRADLTEEEENAVIFREIKQAQETIAATMEEATVLVFIEPSPYTVRINSYRMEEIKHPGAIGIYRRVGTGQFGLIRGRNT